MIKKVIFFGFIVIIMGCTTVVKEDSIINDEKKLEWDLQVKKIDNVIATIESKSGEDFFREEVISLNIKREKIKNGLSEMEYINRDKLFMDIDETVDKIIYELNESWNHFSDDLIEMIKRVDIQEYEKVLWLINEDEEYNKIEEKLRRIEKEYSKKMTEPKDFTDETDYKYESKLLQEEMALTKPLYKRQKEIVINYFERYYPTKDEINIINQIIDIFNVFYEWAINNGTKIVMMESVIDDFYDGFIKMQFAIKRFDNVTNEVYDSEKGLLIYLE